MASLPPASIATDFARAFEDHKSGRIEEAAAGYQRVLSAEPSHADALHLLGTIKSQRGDPSEGERLIAAALREKPDMALMWSNHGNALALLGRRADAISSYERALELAPGLIEAHYSLCGQLIAADRAADALGAMERALDTTPGHHVLTTGRANALMALSRTDEALAGYEAAIAAAPRNIDAICGRGNSLLLLRRPQEALAAFEQVLAMLPGHLDSVLGRANAQVQTGRASEALSTMDRVLAVVPHNALAHYVRGHALLKLVRTGEAAIAFRTAAGLAPDLLEAVYNHADCLRALARYDEAIVEFQRVLDVDPDHSHALNGLAVCAMQCCGWDVQRELTPRIEQKVREGSRGLMPFSFLSLSGSKELQLACSQAFVANTCNISAAPLSRRSVRRVGPIRIGYLSSDFRRHAMAYQMVELFELHDRARFEVVGFSGGQDDGSPVRKRIMAALDGFHDVVGRSDEEIARLIHACDVDIAVDLNGNTIHTLIGALAWRPAAAQATYLGFPGTSGARFIDYVIADDVVAPLSDQAWFSERIVHLPGCYQVSDSQRKPSAKVPSRAACGLPEHAFVFCCFNSSYKISAEIFAIWMRVLKATPGSVLWLVRGGELMERNLRRHAAECGIDPGRLVFCGMVEPEDHLARHALADLYLDTLPYNSHGTGSFALWGGLPILACLGTTFAGRVAASLLQAIGLPELVTTSLDEYEKLAIALAADRARLDGIREKLARNRTSAPLFDTGLFRRHIESAYETMHAIAQRGEAPRSFAVAPITQA